MTLEQYKDLVFSPLALPSPPAIDPQRLIAWMEWGRVEGLKLGRNAAETGYEAATGREYPWLQACIHPASPGEIEESFEREFPQVLQYARRFPASRLKMIALIAQRDNADVHLHADSDGYWGFRFYLTNTRADALYFCLARERLEQLPRRTDDWSALADVRRRHYARWPKENRPYCVNSVRAVHAVDANRCRLGERIACLVIADGHDEAKLLELLEASRSQFGEYQVWYG